MKVLAALCLSLAAIAVAAENKHYKRLEEFIKEVSQDRKALEILEKQMNNQPDQKTLKLGHPTLSCEGAGPSDEVPTSVHALRPGDIKVVAALGDSYTAANGAGASTLVGVLTNYRGKAFAVGGDDNLSKLVTIPNVLRTFNPNLKGQSKGKGRESDFKASQFNVAVQGAVVSDMVPQARDLVARMKANPQLVDIKNDWKLVTIFIGGNDLCDYCGDLPVPGQEYYLRLRAAIRILKAELPRTIVSVVGMARFDMLREVASTKLTCRQVVGSVCPCAFTLSPEQNAANSKDYQEALKPLESGEFDTTDDFTVVIQPGVQDTDQPPRLSTGKVDLSLFSPDCFHLSTKGHDVLSRGLWNNMVEPVGLKDTKINLSVHNLPLKCPDQSCPFIRTTKNSANCAAYLK